MVVPTTACRTALPQCNGCGALVVTWQQSSHHMLHACPTQTLATPKAAHKRNISLPSPVTFDLGQGFAAAAADCAGVEVVQLARRLHALAVSLAPCLCPRAAATHCATTCEALLRQAHVVQGKGYNCNGCHKAYYCGKACQAQHWKHQQPLCKAVAVAASTAAAAKACWGLLM
jgi:hypothetical protein